MRKITLTILFVALGIVLTCPVFAATSTIVLSDGSVIKGEIKSFNNGVYAVDTKNFGRIEVQDANIESIQKGDHALYRPNTTATTTSTAKSPKNVKGQVDAMQNAIVADPVMMAEIANLANDPEIMKMLSDPNFVKAIMSYDVNSIENDPNTQELLKNPKILELMKKVNSKFNTSN